VSSQHNDQVYNEQTLLKESAFALSVSSNVRPSSRIKDGIGLQILTRKEHASTRHVPLISLKQQLSAADTQIQSVIDKIREQGDCFSIITMNIARW
jgi:hypothetical protein